MVEKDTNMFVKCLRTDMEGECTFSEFNEIVNKRELRDKLTTTYTTQYNGVLKRKNRTVMNMIHSMISNKKGSKGFLAGDSELDILCSKQMPSMGSERYNTSRSMKRDKTPNRSLSGIWLLGSCTHSRCESKFDNKSFPCVFFGSQRGVKWV